MRREPPDGFFPARVRRTRGDLTDRPSLIRATKDVRVIYHLGAKLHIPRPSPAERDELRKVNVEGTRALAAAAEANGVSRLVFFSTISVYGPTAPGQFHDESSALRPDSFYAEAKLLAEEQVRAAGVPGVVLRLAAVYGPSMKGNYPRLAEALRRHRFVLVGDGRNRRTLVFTSDVARAARLAAEHPAAPGQTFNVTDGSVHTLKEIVDAICSALGRGAVRFRLPAGPVLRTAGLVESAWSVFGRRAPVGSDTVKKILEDVAVRGEKAAEQLGFRAQTDLLTGWKATLVSRS